MEATGSRGDKENGIGVRELGRRADCLRSMAGEDIAPKDLNCAFLRWTAFVGECGGDEPTSDDASGDDMAG